MLHLGCVAHQFAKWQVPPEKWACTPDAASGSTGSAGGLLPTQHCMQQEQRQALCRQVLPPLQLIGRRTPQPHSHSLD